MAPLPGTVSGSLLGVFHKNQEGAFESLQTFDLSEKILEAISRGERSVSTRFFSRRDLKRLKKMGVEKESEVDLVIEFPWDTNSFLTIAAKTNDIQLRRQVLVMAMDRIRKTTSLERIKGLETCTIQENPYLGPGHVPYENFIDSLLQITDTSTPAGEKLLELFLESAADEADRKAFICVEERGLRTVFHGTNHAVMDAILNSGLDPNCRSKTCSSKDYFGIDYATSEAYTKRKTTPVPDTGHYKLLVFMVIVKPVGDGTLVLKAL